MARESSEIRSLQNRARAIREWLCENAPECSTEQKHLEEGSRERAYWHHGYLMALQDMLRLISEEQPIPRQYTEGISGLN
jgi:hypothetical protein